MLNEDPVNGRAREQMGACLLESPPQPWGTRTQLVHDDFPECQPQPGPLIPPVWKFLETVLGGSAQETTRQGPELREFPGQGGW